LIGVSAWGTNPGLSFSIVALMWGNVAMLTNSLVDARTRRVLAQPRDELGRFVKEE
jgi:hypothetical protein